MDTVSLETGVILTTVSILEREFLVSGEESVLDWLRRKVQDKPLLITNDRGLKVRKVEDR